MNSYKVVWEIDVEAESPHAAAVDAMATMQDKHSEATCYTVIDSSTGESTDVDVNKQAPQESAKRLTIDPEGSLSNEQVEQVKELGWEVYESNPEYTDLHAEISFNEPEGWDDAKSLNASFTFDWSTGQFYIELGDNTGDGFNPHLTYQVIDLDLRTGVINTVHDNQTNEYSQLAVEYPDTHTEILNKIYALSSWLEQSINCLHPEVVA